MSSFESNIVNIYGDRGKVWLSNLKTLLEEIALKWNLSELKPFNNLSYNYVLSGFQNKQPIVLKLGFDIESLQREAEALRNFYNFGAVKILAEKDGALLLERAMPGKSLKSYFPEMDI
jgi:streptomycin 6-kinase